MPGLKFRRKQQKTLTGYEKMLAGAEQFKSNLGPLSSEGAREAGQRASAALHDANDRASRAVNKQRRRAEEKYQQLDDKYRPELYHARDQVIDDYLPRAQKTWNAGNQAVTAAITAAADAGRKEWDKSYPAVRSAALTPTPVKKKKRGVGRTLLVLGLVSAAAAAGYAVYRQSRPVEDPWAPPADFSKAHYPTATDSDSSVVQDSVGGGDSGDVAASLGGSAAGAGASASTSNDSTLSADPDSSGKRAAGSGASDDTEGGANVDSAESESDDDKTEGGSHRGDPKD